MVGIGVIPTMGYCALFWATSLSHLAGAPGAEVRGVGVIFAGAAVIGTYWPDSQRTIEEYRETALSVPRIRGVLKRESVEAAER